MVREGLSGGTWGVVCWYVGGCLVVHEGLSGGTCSCFFNCFVCMKLKDNICKFQYS